MAIKPAIYEDCYEVDISSAYPFAMKNLPQMIKGRYLKVIKFKPDYLGVYNISGSQNNKYPIIYDHEFKIVEGNFKNLWITGFEVKEALTEPGIKLKINYGYIWLPDKSYKHNPLSDYVDHFYKLKQASGKSDANYEFYKRILNACYGKFIQATEIRKIIDFKNNRYDIPKVSHFNGRLDYAFDKVLNKFVQIERTWKAGGMYNPFLATQITGSTRAYLYRLERKYKAIHSATDAIKTQIPVKPIDGLGGLKIETFGRCYIFRNKLYLHFAKDNKYCHHVLNNIKIWDRDQHLCKFGLHGFKGSVQELFDNRHKLLKTGKLTYEYKHMVGLREGFKRNEPICHMITRKETMVLHK